eukprot:4687544-Pleurochrysis_carterae.AAC.2
MDARAWEGAIGARSQGYWRSERVRRGSGGRRASVRRTRERERCSREEQHGRVDVRPRRVRLLAVPHALDGARGGGAVVCVGARGDARLLAHVLLLHGVHLLLAVLKKRLGWRRETAGRGAGRGVCGGGEEVGEGGGEEGGREEARFTRRRGVRESPREETIVHALTQAGKDGGS